MGILRLGSFEMPRGDCFAKICAGFARPWPHLPLMDLLGAIVIVLVLMYARIQIKMGLMTAGIFVTFVYALFKSYEPVKGLGTVYQQFEQGLWCDPKKFLNI